jgi:TrmH family RNA methyltransferase
MLITSPKNEKVKRLVRLKDRKGRDEEKTAIIEGYRAISRALDAGLDLKELYFCPSLFLGENENKLIAISKDRNAEIFETTEEVFAKFAYRDRPEGLVATIQIREHKLSDIKICDNGTYLIVEGIEKPGNLGSILRSADASGVSAVIICEKRTDIYNPNVITASTGTIFSVPLAEDSKENVFNWLKQNGIRIVATTPHTRKIYSDENFTGANAILVGSEQCGLSSYWIEKADTHIRIPMLGKADSLNVAVSATLILYELARQKGWHKPRKSS